MLTGANVIKIPLTQGKVALIDADDHQMASKYKWFYNKRGYAARSIYKKLSKNNYWRGIIYLHREVLGNPSDDIDHINRNSLDNRKANLRLATTSQNLSNSNRKVGVSGYRGVHPEHKKWRITVQFKGIPYNGGLYDSVMEAAKKRDELALKIQGKFAKLNFNYD